MTQFRSAKLGELIGRSFTCECGRIHTAAIQELHIASGALAEIPAVICRGGWKKPFIIADQNTYKVAGELAAQHLAEAGIPFGKIVLQEAAVVPNEHTIGSIVMHFDQEADIIIGVGSGTINDMSRFLSSRLKLPYIIAATAPSMDGYASTVAPLITNNLKTTYQAGVPYAIIGDLDVLANAPQEMIAAGFGDILGKYTALADWRLSAAITGEYYCPNLVQLVQAALQDTLSLQDGLAQRDKAAVKCLMEALVLSGLAMAYAGYSRPASGSEHHVAHFWEVRALLVGQEHPLHGTSVGAAARLIARLHEYLQEVGLSPEEISARPVEFHYPAWERAIRRAYDKAADEVLQLEETVGKNDPANQRARLKAAAERWNEVLAISRGLPTSGELGEMLAKVGGPTAPGQLGIGPELLKDSLLYAKELRNRYTILQLLFDLGLLESFAQRLVEEEFAGQ